MKKTIFLVIAVIMISSLASAQIKPIIAVTDFYYEGEVWTEQLGNYIAKELRQRLYFDFDSTFSVMLVEEANDCLIDSGVTYAYGSSSEQITEAFFKKGVRFAVIGRIEKIIQTGDVDGSAEVKIVATVNLFDVKNNSGIRTFEAEHSIRVAKKIRPDTPWNEEVARSLVNRLVFKIAAQIKDVSIRYRRR